MPRNLNISVWSESDGTTRDNVPDWLVHVGATWIGEDDLPHSLTEDAYFLVLLNWLANNHPAAAKQLMQGIAVQILRVQYGVDSEFHNP